MLPTSFFCFPYPYAAMNPYLHPTYSYSPFVLDPMRDNLFRTHDQTPYSPTVITLNSAPQPS